MVRPIRNVVNLIKNVVNLIKDKVNLKKKWSTRLAENKIHLGKICCQKCGYLLRLFVLVLFYRIGYFLASSV